MKARIGNVMTVVLMVFPCLAFVVAAAFLSLSSLKHYSVPVQAMREEMDPSITRHIMVDAETMLKEGEETLAQEMVEKNEDVQEKMKIATQSFDHKIHATEIVHLGMVMAEAILMEGPRPLARDANKVDAGLATEKGH